MRKGFFLQIAVGFVLLSVLFTQVGVNLLHAHQGTPEHLVTVHNAPDMGSTCQACGLMGMPSTLFAAAEQFLIPSFSKHSFDEVLALSILHSSSAPTVGRAPPVC